MVGPRSRVKRLSRVRFACVDRHLPGIAKKYIREQRSVQTFQGKTFRFLHCRRAIRHSLRLTRGLHQPDAPVKVELTVATEKKIRAHIEQKAPVVFVCSDAAALSIRGGRGRWLHAFRGHKPAQPGRRSVQTALGEVNVGRKYVLRSSIRWAVRLNQRRRRMRHQALS